jgi:hypothetical protein
MKIPILSQILAAIVRRFTLAPAFQALGIHIGRVPSQRPYATSYISAGTQDYKHCRLRPIRCEKSRSWPIAA